MGVKEKKTRAPVPLSDWNSGGKLNPRDLPAHGLIKLKLPQGFGFFLFIEIRLIKIRFQPVRWCASWRKLRRCGRFTDVDQDTLNWDPPR
jgi:hypothetical protein